MKASYFAKRILSAVVIMLAVASIVFFAMRVIPSDPAQVVLGTYATEEALQAFRREMGLDGRSGGSTWILSAIWSKAIWVAP